MKRYIGLILVSGLLMGILLSGCGGGDDKNNDKDTATSVQASTRPAVLMTSTPRSPAPRSRTVPADDPQHFEAPLSVGSFVRESMTGNPAGTQTGGLQAAYTGDNGGAVLTVYHFSTPEQAVESVRFALESSSIVEQVDKPFYDPVVAYGLVRDRHGAYLAVWSHYEWFFMVRTTGDLDALNTFMETFPY